jgi:aspartyl/asparaginyl beta-hydroxylase (cupin superfamily)
MRLTCTLLITLPLYNYQAYCFTPSAIIPISSSGRSSSSLSSPLLLSSSPVILKSAVANTDTNSVTDKKDDDFRQTTTIPPTDTPLSINTYAGQIENAIITKYGSEETKRVIQSWRLLDLDYEHREYVGGNTDIGSIISKDESNCYQYTHSYVHGLTCVPFWDATSQPWAKKLSNKYKTIRREFLNVISEKNKDTLTKEGNNIWAGALTEEAGGYGEGWSTLVLMNRGMWDETNCNLFPQTAKAVLNSGIPATEVFFASMKPQTDIKLHSDFTNFVLTSHLAVDIPESGNNKCRLSVGDETREWINGEVTLFDTSIMHDAINESDEMRYILMFRVWHPDLTDVEKDALQLIYDCLEVPDLLSEDEAIRINAEKQIAQVRTFPKLKNATSGFGSRSTGAKKKKKKGKR